MKLGLTSNRWLSYMIYPVLLLTIWPVFCATSYARPSAMLPIALASVLQEEPQLPARDWQAGATNLAVDAQVLGACYYDLANGATCVLTFNNKGPATLDVTPTLYNLAGQVRVLAIVSVPANRATYVDIRTWVPVGDASFEQGSIHLTYQGESLRLGAQVRIARTSDQYGL